jgi:adenosylcobinamide-phosphate synthase
MLVALLVDTLVGWPPRLYRAIGHPVTWIGRLIAALDRTLNSPAISPTLTRVLGIVTLVVVVSAAALPAALLQYVLADWPFGWLLMGALAWPLVAARSLYEHVAAVLTPLQRGDLAAARAEVAMIVGRDVTQLDEAAVARAAIESLAENASDGVVAPLFWGVLLGLPGIAAYKAVNTLDSMIGHLNERHRHFGWASARLDDVANLVPARLTGLLIAIVSSSPRGAVSVMLRDGAKHRSPNAGFPEAAMAGAVGIRLSGPRVYHDRIADEPWLNPTAPDPRPSDLARALQTYVRAMLAAAVLMAVIGAVAAL